MPDFPSTKVRPLEERIDELTRRVIEMDNRLKKLKVGKTDVVAKSAE